MYEILKLYSNILKDAAEKNDVFEIYKLDLVTKRNI